MKVFAALLLQVVARAPIRAAWQTTPNMTAQCSTTGGRGGVESSKAWRPPPSSYNQSRFGLHPSYWTPYWTHRGADVLDLPALRRLAVELRQLQPKGTSISNKGGWQSAGNLLEHKLCAQSPAFAGLVNEITYQTKAFLEASVLAAGASPLPPYSVRIQRVWANVNEPGDFNNQHIHGMCHVSGAIFVDSGADAGPSLELLDPRNDLRGPTAALLADRRSATDHAPLPDVWQAGTRELLSIFTRFVPICTLHDRQTLGVGRGMTASPGMAVVFPAWLPHWVRPHAGQALRLSFSFNARVEPDAGAPLHVARPRERVDVAPQRVPARAFLRGGIEPGQVLIPGR